MALFDLPFLDTIRKTLENIVQFTNTTSGSTTLSNGQFATFTMTTTSTSKAPNQAAPDITLYLTSATAANAFPGGANIDMSQWQIVGPSNDWGATDNKNTVTKIYIRNISAGASQTILFRGQSRIIVNSFTSGGS